MGMLFKSPGGSTGLDEWVEKEMMSKEDDMSVGGWSNIHLMLVFLIKHNMPWGKLGLISSSSNTENTELRI